MRVLEEEAYSEDTLDRVHALSKEIHAQLLKAGAGDGRVKVSALEQGINLDAGLGGTGQRPLCPLRSCQ